jgi:hypothetical protein
LQSVSAVRFRWGDASPRTARCLESARNAHILRAMQQASSDLARLCRDPAVWRVGRDYQRRVPDHLRMDSQIDYKREQRLFCALARRVAVRLTIGALEHAIERRQPKPGLVHHSDRRFQCAHAEYMTSLEKYHMVPSISRPANPYDKDYASHCTSWVRCDTTSLAMRRCDSFMPWAFRGGLSPGCSYRQWFLLLQA